MENAALLAVAFGCGSLLSSEPLAAAAFAVAAFLVYVKRTSRP